MVIKLQLAWRLVSIRSGIQVCESHLDAALCFETSDPGEVDKTTNAPLSVSS